MNTVAFYLTATPDSRGVNMDGRRVIRFDWPERRVLIWHQDRVDLVKHHEAGLLTIDRLTITDDVLRQLRSLWRKAGRAK